jgi:xanthine dehydrogenase accessory factor
MIRYAADQEVLQQAIKWLQIENEIRLITVITTWGSAPRPCGSLMVIRQNGESVGSVSAGCIEQDLIEHNQQQHMSSFPNIITYGINRKESNRFGLPCGGRLAVLIEKIDQSQTSFLQTLLEKSFGKNPLLRQVNLATGVVTYFPATPSYPFSYKQNIVSKVFGSAWHMLLIGAGQLADYLAQFAILLGYQITLCDPRKAQRPIELNKIIQFTRLMPDDAVTALNPIPYSIVITLSHDPKLDDLALLEALPLDLFYVGALGSKRTSEDRRKRLSSLGLISDQLDKLHAPVGLAIGSHTPAEIALAIMAEITALRNRT